MALAIAWAAAKRRSALLLDLDLEAPSLAIRIAKTPRPDITDACDEIQRSGRLPAWVARRFGPLGVIVGSHRPTDDHAAPYAVADLVEAARTCCETVVVDAGPATPGNGIIGKTDRIVLVVGGSPNGLIRAAHLVADWPWSTPLLILNRVPFGGEAEMANTARHCLGLDPAAVVVELPDIAAHAGAGARPHRLLVKVARQVLDVLEASPHPNQPLGSHHRTASL